VHPLLHQPANESDLEATDLQGKRGRLLLHTHKPTARCHDAWLPTRYVPIEFGPGLEMADTPEPCRIHDAFVTL